MIKRWYQELIVYQFTLIHYSHEIIKGVLTSN